MSAISIAFAALAVALPKAEAVLTEVNALTKTASTIISALAVEAPGAEREITAALTALEAAASACFNAVAAHHAATNKPAAK